MIIFTLKKENWSLLLLLITTSLSSYAQTITGTVFRDFNSNGTYESITNPASYTYGEPGVGGVTVTAYNAVGTAVATTVSSTLASSSGSYTLTVGNTSAYRVEFTNLITNDYETFRGANNATAVQFVNGGSSNVNFGVNYPANYCQSVSPQMVTSCYASINPTNTPALETRPGIVGLPYTVVESTKVETEYATIGDVGAVWGIGYKKDTRQIFSSAFTKRHVGFTDGGPNAIYVTTPSTGVTTQFFNFTTVGGTAVTSTTEAHGNDLPTPGSGSPTSGQLASYDIPAFDAVGKTSFGGLDISDDDKTIYVVNLKDRKLYTIDIATKTATGYSIPNPGCTTTGTTVNGSYRPFAVKYYRGKVYVGVVCTREDLGSSVVTYGSTAGLSGTVYEVDPATPGSFTTIALSFPLTYQKSPTNADRSGQERAEYWRPWTSIYQADRDNGNNGAAVSYPQAWLTDIEFEPGTGDMLVGLRDRFGDQIGFQNRLPNTSTTRLVSGITPGEILRARKCSLTATQWTLESNGLLCGIPTSTSATQTTVAGPGGGKYYWGDRVQNGDNHGMSSQAGIAQLAGSAKVAMTAIDPLDEFNTGGIKRLINATGAKDGNAIYTVENENAGAELYASDALGYGKANGLGDLELFCNPAPIEIGNRVWLDSDNDGVQDPGETPIAGVTVLLKGPGLPGAGVSVTTNSTGEYYFSSGSGTAATGFVYSLTGLTAGGSYSLTFPTSVTTGNSVLSSKPNSAPGANADNIDTDPNAAGVITFTLGQTGQNNFSYDAGYVPCTPPSLTALASSASVCAGESVTLTAQVSPAGSYTYAWSAPAGITLTGATTATATATGLTTGTRTFTVTVSTSPICSTTATVAVVVNATPTASLSASQVTICAGQSTTLTASGGSTYRFSSTGTTSSTATAVVSPTVTTTYSVTVTNASGCSSTATTTVTVNALPVASLTASTGLSTATICVGQSVSLTASGGTSYSFSTGLTNTTGLLVVSPTTTTTYSVTVANASGCTSTTTATVTVNALPVPSMASATICAGQSTTLTASGGTSYTFSTGLTNATGLLVVSPATTTTYSVTVANASGCVSTTTSTVTVNALPVASLTASTGLNTATICVGQSVSLTASGGTSYTFSTGLTNATGLLVVSPTTTTTYSVTVANASGCRSTTTATVTVNALPTVTATSATVCAGQSAMLTASGASTYLWSSGATTASISVSVAGAYSVTGTSAEGCSAIATTTLTVNPLPVATLSSATICAGQSVTLTASGGTSYSFSTGTTNTTGLLVVSPTTTTTYSVTAANANGCVSTTTATVTANALPTPAMTSATICAGQSTTLTASGGTSYSFSTGLTNTTGQLVVTPASTTVYSVTVATSAGCQATATGGVTVNNNPTASLSSATICVGQSVTLTATGGASYSFSNGTTNTTGLLVVSPASTTTYSVTASSGANCSATATGVITVDPLPVASMASATICAGQSATLTASEGTSYSFSTGLTNATGLLVVSPATTTTYSVTVANASGCVSTTTGTVTVNALPVASLTASTGLSTATLCAGQSTTLTASGGTSYSFSTGLTNATGLLVVSPTITTTYSVTVANASGCASTATGTVTVNDLPTPAMTSATICAGQSTTLTASGGTSYSFSTGLTNITGLLAISPTTTTTYSVTVANASGCTSTTTGTVTVNDLPNGGADQVLVCGPLGATPTSTSLAASLAGGSWSNAPGNPTTATFSPISATTTVSNLTTGTYTFIYTAPNGCTDTVNVTVPVCQTFCATISVAASANSSTLTPGQSVTLTADVSPVGSYTYVWSGPGTITPSNTLSAVVSGLPSGVHTFTVTVTSSPGCLTTATVSVTVLTPTLAVSVTPGDCQPTNSYILSGTISLSATIASTLTISDGSSTTTVSVNDGQESASFSLTGLTSGSGSHTVTVSGTGYTPVSTTYSAPASCTVEIGLSVTPGICQTATNQYSISGMISLTNAIAGTATITDGTSTTTVTISAGATSVPYALSGLTSGTDSHTVTLSYADQTVSQTYTAPLSCTVGVALSVTPGSCQTATNQYSISGTISLTNAIAGTATITDGTSTTTLTVNAGDTALPYSLDGLASGTDSHTVTVSYANQTVSITYTAPVSCTVAPASLGDFVWVDSDRDGIQDSGEPGIPGVTVVLLDGSNTPIASTTTDGSGLYSFTGLTPGTPYSVSFVTPAGYTSTSAQQGGNDTQDSDASTTTGQTRSVTLAPGENNPNLDAGYYVPLGSIGDYVWIDADQNGQQDAGEVGIDGVTVRLLQETTPGTYTVVSTTLTAGGGLYLFTDLPAGTYLVEFVGSTLPPNYVFTTTDASGVADDLDNDANPVTGRTAPVVLVPLDPTRRNILTLDAGVYDAGCPPAKCVPLVITRTR